MKNKVVTFHEVHDAHWFESVVLMLQKKYKIISASDIYNYYYNGTSLRNSCLITVDDGHETSYSVIYKILKKYNIPAIFFVSPQMAQNTNSLIYWFQALKQCPNKEIYSEIVERGIGIDEIWNRINHYVKQGGSKLRYNINMTVEQIKQIDSEGLVTIGAHTMLHPVLARESDARSKKEIVDSIMQLEQMLGHQILCFAYPNGRPILDWGKREMETLQKTTVRLAFSTSSHNFSYKDNPYAIPRFGISKGRLSHIRLKLLLGKYYVILRSLIKNDLSIL